MKQPVHDPREAFPGHGRTKAAEAMFEWLLRGVPTHDRARHPKTSRGILRQGSDVMFAFIMKLRGIWPLRTICEALSSRIQTSMAG